MKINAGSMLLIRVASTIKIRGSPVRLPICMEFIYIYIYSDLNVYPYLRGFGVYNY